MKNAINAGLQIKASIKSSAFYIPEYFCRKAYYNIYHVVYFDLGDDFDTTRQKLLDLRTGKISNARMSEESTALCVFKTYKYG